MTRTIYIVDDDAGIRGELTEFLRTSGMEVCSFPDGEVLLDRLEHLVPGVVILDLNLPGRDGLAVQAALLERKSPHQVIMLTGEGSISRAVTAMRAGACDFLEKPFPMSELLASLDRAFKRMVVSEIECQRRGEALARLQRLSKREREVLDLLVAGRPNKIIAFELSLSIRTIEVYRANLMHKLGTRSLSDAVKLALTATESFQTSDAA